MDRIEPNGLIGRDTARVEGVDKVTGRAVYAADQQPQGMAYAFLVTATIARGRITRIDQEDAWAIPGVIDILTYHDVGGQVGPGKWFKHGGHMTTGVAPLGSDQVHYAGQIVAVVIADTFEVARDAAALVRVEYAVESPAATFDQPGTEEAEPESLGEPELVLGDVNRAYLDAPVTVEGWYETGANHHNPLELFQATCAWDGGRLIVWESTQHVRGCQYGVAEQLGLSPDQVRVLSPLIGGAFGSRGELGQHTALIAFAARKLGRPVKLVATRQQNFDLRTFRAETRHHIKLGADRGGKLQVLVHDAWELTSRTEPFALAGSAQTARLYACPNIRTRVRNVRADRQTPGFMRAPPETPYLFALETAMDELAVALNVDPLALRRRNDTMTDPIKGLPYTSRSLLQCIDAGAAAFGWDRREPRAGAMRDGDALIGFGYATALYPTQMGPADARVTLFPDLHAIVEVGTHEIGTGIRTVLAQTVADLLGLEIREVEVRIGDSALPAAPLSAGSNSTATVCTVVAMACDALRLRIARAAVGDGPLAGADPERVRLRQGKAEADERSVPLEAAVARAAGGEPMVENATNSPHGIPPQIGPPTIRRGGLILTGGASLKDRLQFAFGAQFVEVRVDRFTGEIRVPRMVGAFAAGRIMNPRTARAQLTGGMIWGMSSALLEKTEIDLRDASYVNKDLAEYHVPVNADVGEVTALMLDERDELVNPLGIKGLGELGITGMNAAVANAVFHATGVRLRRIPIRMDDLRGGPFMAA